MPKKEDVSIVRARDFQQVDEDLTSAMENLDAANLRIAELLDGSDEKVEQAAGDDAAEDDTVSEQPDGDASPSEDEKPSA